MNLTEKPINQLTAAELDRIYQDAESIDDEMFAEMRSNVLLVSGDHYTMVTDHGKLRRGTICGRCLTECLEPACRGLLPNPPVQPQPIVKMKGLSRRT